MDSKLKSMGVCKVWVFFLLFCTLMAMAARADEASFRATTVTQSAGPLNIQLSAQLWWRPIEHGRELEFEEIGKPQAVSASLTRANPRKTVPVEISKKDLFAIVRLFLAFPHPDSGNEPYVNVQTRIFHPTRGLIAECANFDTLHRPRGIGVGACSGVVGNRQFGVTLSKVVE